jgi:hypothetical protein
MIARSFFLLKRFLRAVPAVETPPPGAPIKLASPRLRKAIDKFCGISRRGSIDFFNSIGGPLRSFIWWRCSAAHPAAVIRLATGGRSQFLLRRP